MNDLQIQVMFDRLRMINESLQQIIVLLQPVSDKPSEPS